MLTFLLACSLGHVTLCATKEQLHTQKNTMPHATQEEFSRTVKRSLLTHPRYTTLSELARSLGYHRNTVSRAIHLNAMPRVRKAVAPPVAPAFA